MPLIESSKTNPNTQIKPAPTETGNNSAFHATFGVRSDNKYVYQDIVGLKTKIATNVRSIVNQTHTLYPSVQMAMVQLIEQSKITLDNSTPKLQQYQTEYHTTGKYDVDANDIPDMIKEYAKLIEADRALTHYDLEVVAHAHTDPKTHPNGITIAQYDSKNSSPKILNPGQPLMAHVFLNDKDEYQAMVEDHGIFSTQFGKLSHDSPFYLAKTGTYSASGLKLAFHGNIYQLKLLMLFAIRGAQDNLSFYIGTEMDSADKFDDLVFKSKGAEESTHTYDFLQAKHKQDNTKLVSSKDLNDTNEGEFSLPKYFTSYKKIKNNTAFNDGNLGLLYLCTNIDLDPNIQANFDLITTPSRLLDTHIPGEKRYQIKKDTTLNKEIYDTLRTTTEGYKLASKLVENSLIPPKTKTSNNVTLKTLLFKEHHVNLANAQVIVNGKLTQNFIDGNVTVPAWVNEFRTLLIDEARKGLKDKKYKTFTDVDILKELASKMKAAVNFGVADGSLPIDLEVAVTDMQINAFFDHFVLAVKQSDEVQLGEIIARELGDEFNLVDGDFIYSELEKAMLDWMKDKQGTYITHEATSEFFGDIRKRLSRFALIGPTFAYQQKLDEAKLSFQPVLGISQFLGTNTHQLMLYETPGEAFLGSLQVYQTVKNSYGDSGLDSSIFVSLQNAVRLKDMLAQGFTKDKGLLVFICKQALTEAELKFVEKLSTQIKTQQKVIFVIKQKDAEGLKKLLSISTLQATDIPALHNYSQLDKGSQIKVAAQPLLFQGKKATLQTVVGGATQMVSFIDTEVLTELLNLPKDGIHVGEPLPPLVNKEFFVKRELSLPLAKGIHLLSAGPGMGKTAFIEHWVDEKTKSDSQIWAVKIDLSAPKTQIKLDEYTKNDKEKMILFFLGKDASMVARKVFEKRLEAGKLLIIVDNFDKLPTMYQAKTLQLLTHLKTTEAQTVVITTPDRTEALTSGLDTAIVATYDLGSFKGAAFLNLYIPQAVQGRKLSDDPNVQKQIVEVVKKHLSSQEVAHLVNHPLQAQLLVEYCLNQLVIDNNNSNISIPLTKTAVYHHFLQSKYHVSYLHHAKPQLFTATYLQMGGGFNELVTPPSLTMQHQHYAFNTIFPTFSAQSRRQYKVHCDPTIVKTIGIIQFDNANAPQFSHQSFTKYLAAEFLFSLLSNNNLDMFNKHYQPFLLKHIFKDSHTEILQLLEEMVATDPQREEEWKKVRESNLLPTTQRFLTIEEDTIVVPTSPQPDLSTIPSLSRKMIEKVCITHRNSPQFVEDLSEIILYPVVGINSGLASLFNQSLYIDGSPLLERAQGIAPTLLLAMDHIATIQPLALLDMLNHAFYVLSKAKADGKLTIFIEQNGFIHNRN